jgi:hypothetical protein
MGDTSVVTGIFVAKLHPDDRSILEALKRHPRETYGDVVHWLAEGELERRGRSGHSQPADPDEVPA